MNGSPPPILVCYDGTPAAQRAIEGAGRLFPGRPAIVLYIFAGVAAQRVRTTSVERVRDELIEEVRVAARREAAAVAEEGTNLALSAGLEAKPLAVETGDRTADAIIRVALKQSVAAVVVGRSSQARPRLRAGGVARSIVDHCPIPVVAI